MSISTKKNHNSLLMFTLTLGVFGILNTEMGVVGIIPIIADTFGVTVPDAGWTVSLFALIIAFSAPRRAIAFFTGKPQNGHGTCLVRICDIQPCFGLHDKFYRTADNPCRSGILSSVVRIHRFFNCRLVRQSGRKLRKPFPKSSPEYRREWCSEYL